MTEIKLYNTKTRKKEIFAPINPKNVRMYVCGPTVYDRAHIGNARPVVVFDTLFRLLQHEYPKVTYVRNFTDVDDKINARAAEMKAGGDDRDLKKIIRELTDETIKWYHEDMGALGALRPTHEPRATEYISQMIVMIEGLIEKGNAYESEGHVLFDVNSYDAYGALSGRKLEDMRAGERVEVADYKRDPMDFVLWKPSTGDLPGWDSPWGWGRPGWHIECSAMSLELLGATFDIHGGGLDLQFPHHENEIAQSCCANPDDGFANVWMHNEMIQVEGKKMSKSLGNFFTVKDLLDKGIPGEVIRLVLLSTHYAKPVDWTDSKLEESWNKLLSWRSVLELGVDSHISVSSSYFVDELAEILADDLATSEAISRIDDFAGEAKHNRSLRPHLLAGLEFMGLQKPVAKEMQKLRGAIRNLTNSIGRIEELGLDPAQLLNYEMENIRFKKPLALDVLRFFVTNQLENNYKKIEDQIERTGPWIIIARKYADTSVTHRELNRMESTIGFEGLNKLIEERQQAKLDKNYELSDKIRNKLEYFGYILKDSKGGPKWKMKKK